MLTGSLDAVGVVVFSASSAREQVCFVVFFVAGREGLLNAAAGGRVIARNGEAYHAAVAEFDGHLHESLTEGAATDDGGAVVVLHRAGKDLTGRSTRFVDEDNERQMLVSAAPVALVLLLIEATSLRVDDESVFRQELIGHIDGGLQVSAEVAAQVDHQVLHPFGAERGHGGQEVAVSVVAPRRNADVSGRGVEHIGGVYAVDGHIAAHDGEFLQPGLSGTAHGEDNFGTAFAFEALHRALGVDIFPDIGFSVDRHDAIAGTKANIFGGAAGDDAHHAYSVLIDGELHPNAGETPAQVLHGGLNIFGRDVSAVGIQLFEDLWHGTLHEIGHVDRVDVTIVDNMEQIAELIARGVDETDAIAGKMRGIKASDEYADDDCDGDVERKQTRCVVFHVQKQDLLFGKMQNFDLGTPQQFQTGVQSVFSHIDYTANAGLNDEFCALDAGFVGDIECGAVGVVA